MSDRFALPRAGAGRVHRPAFFIARYERRYRDLAAMASAPIIGALPSNDEPTTLGEKGKAWATCSEIRANTAGS